MRGKVFLSSRDSGPGSTITPMITDSILEEVFLSRTVLGAAKNRDDTSIFRFFEACFG